MTAISEPASTVGAAAANGAGSLIFAHEQPDGSSITFIRTGECCQCGECCWGDPFNGAMGKPVITDACPLLRLQADGLYRCIDRQNSYYLNGCNVWPTHPRQIIDKPSCSYRFEKVTAS